MRSGVAGTKCFRVNRDAASPLSIRSISMKLFIPAVFLILYLSCTSLAQPARCDEPRTACSAFADADMVFVGLVTKVVQPELMIWMRDQDYDQTAYVKIEKSYKGKQRRTITFTQLGRDESPKLIPNTRYIFYAKYDSAAKIWKVGRCGRRLIAKHAQDDLSFLDTMAVNRGKTRISGNVVFYDPSNGMVAEAFDLASGVRIKIIGDTKTYEVVTDAKGNYEIYGVVPGGYVFRLEAPKGLGIYGAARDGVLDRTKTAFQDIELTAAQCVQIDVILAPEESIRSPERNPIGAIMTDAESSQLRVH